jgi:glutamate-1-semialdehyde 2,1-aminomutase
LVKNKIISNSGLEMWDKSKKIIPGGNGLLSKRPERYAPDIWPTYYTKAKGVDIWDLDGNKYIDMAQMGIGVAILGYCNDDVDKAVKESIDRSVNTTLNAPEEYFLAKRLLELNEFAGGVKFARSGAEAMSIAIRIARAYSKRDLVIFSGYHGWSDWYLSTNLQNPNNLNNHLLSGLSALGVPKKLAGTTIPLKYNDPDELTRIVTTNNDVGVIVLEGARYDYPTSEFIDTINNLAKKHEIVIICDEITSGWRVTDGGVYKTNNLKPDIVVYGKGMGNGYAISSVVGKSEVMDVAQETFISSTFWTERIGFVSALKTIEIITKNKVWEHLIEMGSMIGKGWIKLARKHDLRISITEFKPCITMKLDYGNMNNEITTFFTQEMLARGYLAGPSVYPSFSHDSKTIEKYLNNVDEVFNILSKTLRENTLKNFLKTKVRKNGFIRLT